MLERFFNDSPQLGFINNKIVCFKDRKKLDLEAVFEYILREDIDELFCSIKGA